MSRSRTQMVIRIAITILIACISWVVLAFLLTAPLGAWYGWSGHPAMPAAPWAVYALLYLVILPALCLGGSWRLTRRITS